MRDRKQITFGDAMGLPNANRLTVQCSYNVRPFQGRRFVDDTAMGCIHAHAQHGMMQPFRHCLFRYQHYLGAVGFDDIGIKFTVFLIVLRGDFICIYLAGSDILNPRFVKRNRFCRE